MGNDPKSDSTPAPQPPGAGAGPGGGKSGWGFKPFFGSARKTLASIGAAVVGFGGVSASIFLLGQEIPQVPGVMNGVVTTFHQPRHPGTHVVFVSNDELLAKSYLSLLADSGATTDYIDTSQIEMLPHLNPDLVIFGSG